MRRTANEVRPAIDEICNAQLFILGPQVEAMEKAVADHTGCAQGIGVSSGTDTLFVALHSDAQPAVTTRGSSVS